MDGSLKIKFDATYFTLSTVTSVYNTVNQMKEKQENEILYYTNKINVMEKNLKLVLSEKTKADSQVILLQERVDDERREKLLLETQLKKVKQSLEEQSRKTQDALNSLCH